MTALLLAHAAATLGMTGVIWFVQVVHYPLFARVGEAGFAAYEEAHRRLTTLVVAPTMLVEAGTGVALLAARPDGVSAGPAWAGLVLLVVAWLSTVLVQVPCHDRLQRGFDPGVARRLVRTNWLRTAAWTARSGLVLALLAQAVG
ncbi:MAG: hypothetical protein R3C15_03975 [Thermoleophilia bacterium]